MTLRCYLSLSLMKYSIPPFSTVLDNSPTLKPEDYWTFSWNSVDKTSNAQSIPQIMPMTGFKKVSVTIVIVYYRSQESTFSYKFSHSKTDTSFSDYVSGRSLGMSR